MNLVKQDELQSRIEEMTKFSNQLIGQFQTSSQKSIALVELLRRMNDSQRGVFRSKEQVRDQIHLLVKIAPQTFKLISTASGQMLKLL